VADQPAPLNCRIISYIALAMVLGCASNESTHDVQPTDVVQQDDASRFLPADVNKSEPDLTDSTSDTSQDTAVDKPEPKPDIAPPEDAGQTAPKVTINDLFLSSGAWPACTDGGEHLMYPTGYSPEDAEKEAQLIDVTIRRFHRTALTNDIAAQSACIVSTDAKAGHSVLYRVTDKLIAYKRTCVVAPPLHQYHYALMTAGDGKSSLDDLFKDAGADPVIKAWDGEVCALVDRSASGALACYVKSIGWQPTRNELYVASFDVFGNYLVYTTHNGLAHIIQSDKESAQATGLKATHITYHASSDSFFALDEVAPNKVQVVRFSTHEGTVITVPPFEAPTAARGLAVTADERVIYSVLNDGKRELRWRQAGYKEDHIIASEHAGFEMKDGILLFLEGSTSSCSHTLKRHNFETSKSDTISENAAAGVTDVSWQKLASSLYFAVPSEPGSPPDCNVKSMALEHYDLDAKTQTTLLSTKADWWRVTSGANFWLGASMNDSLSNKLEPNGIASIWTLTSPAEKLKDRPSLVGPPRQCGDCWLLLHRDKKTAGKGMSVSEWCSELPAN